MLPVKVDITFDKPPWPSEFRAADTDDGWFSLTITQNGHVWKTREGKEHLRVLRKHGTRDIMYDYDLRTGYKEFRKKLKQCKSLVSGYASTSNKDRAFRLGPFDDWAKQDLLTAGSSSSDMDTITSEVLGRSHLCLPRRSWASGLGAPAGATGSRCKISPGGPKNSTSVPHSSKPFRGARFACYTTAFKNIGATPFLDESWMFVAIREGEVIKIMKRSNDFAKQSPAEEARVKEARSAVGISLNEYIGVHFEQYATSEYKTITPNPFTVGNMCFRVGKKIVPLNDSQAATVLFCGEVDAIDGNIPVEIKTVNAKCLPAQGVRKELWNLGNYFDKKHSLTSWLQAYPIDIQQIAVGLHKNGKLREIAKIDVDELEDINNKFNASWSKSCWKKDVCRHNFANVLKAILGKVEARDHSACRIWYNKGDSNMWIQQAAMIFKNGTQPLGEVVVPMPLIVADIFVNRSGNIEESSFKRQIKNEYSEESLDLMNADGIMQFNEKENALHAIPGWLSGRSAMHPTFVCLGDVLSTIGTTPYRRWFNWKCVVVRKAGTIWLAEPEDEKNWVYAKYKLQQHMTETCDSEPAVNTIISRLGQTVRVIKFKLPDGKVLLSCTDGDAYCKDALISLETIRDCEKDVPNVEGDEELSRLIEIPKCGLRHISGALQRSKLGAVRTNGQLLRFDKWRWKNWRAAH